MSKVQGKQINPVFTDPLSAPSITADVKHFVIKHPDPSKTGVLVHTCIEGPENGVYVRGKSKGNIITLPDYWKYLVDENTITVNLTPINRPLDLYIKNINSETIKIGCKDEFIPLNSLEFFWIIYATRKDVPVLIIEQQNK